MKALALITDGLQFLINKETYKFFNNRLFNENFNPNFKKTKDLDIALGFIGAFLTTLNEFNMKCKAIIRSNITEGIGNNIFFLKSNHDTVGDLCLVAVGKNLALKKKDEYETMLNIKINESLTGPKNINPILFQENIAKDVHADLIEELDMQKNPLIDEKKLIKDFEGFVELFPKNDAKAIIYFIIQTITNLIKETIKIDNLIVKFLFETNDGTKQYILIVSNQIISFINSFSEIDSLKEDKITSLVYSSGNEYLEKYFEKDLNKFFEAMHDLTSADFITSEDRFLFLKFYFELNPDVNPKIKNVKELLSSIKPTNQDASLIKQNFAAINLIKNLKGINAEKNFPTKEIGLILPLIRTLAQEKEVGELKVNVFNDLYLFFANIYSVSIFSAEQKQLMSNLIEQLSKIFKQIDAKKKSLIEAQNIKGTVNKIIEAKANFNNLIKKAIENIENYDSINELIQGAIESLKLVK